MTRADGKRLAPAALATFLIAIEGLEAPDSVFAVVTSIQAVIFDKNPRAALSKRCCRLREARPGVFREVWRWLMTPQVKSAARRSGAIWAWRVWCKACAAIDRGWKPHVAFGMNKPGRPVEMHFSAADDAAMYAEYLHQCEGVPINVAEDQALAASMDMTGRDEVSRRGLQRARKDYKSCGDTLLNVPDALRMKYPEFNK